MSVDPGLGGTGWALWMNQAWPDLASPVLTGVCKATTPRDWVERSNKILVQFAEVLAKYDPMVCYVEFPQFFEKAEGVASAAKGDLQKLTFMVGRIAEACQRNGIRFVPIEVTRWNGGLPKPVVARRVARKLGVPAGTYPDHAMDAVGIGLYCKGVWNDKGKAL